MLDKQHVMRAAAEDQAQVIPGALAVGEVPTWVEIDPAEYVGRREDERASAARSLAIHGSWEAVAAIMMETMVYMAPASHQWGSHHHQLAIVAAGLRNRLAALEASSRQEERLASAVKDFRWRANQCRTNLDAYDSSAAAIWDLAADALEGK